MFWAYLIYGGGYGLPSKSVDKVFYNLNGVIYTLSGYYGCQLESYEFRRPCCNEVRLLAGVPFISVSCESRCFLKRISWRMLNQSTDIGVAKKQIDEFRELLRKL